MNLGQEYYENLCMRGVNQSIGKIGLIIIIVIKQYKFVYS